MMKYIILYTALLLLIHSAVSADTCTSLPVPDQTYECSAPGVMTASQIPDFPSSGAKQITLLFDVQVLDFCGVDRDVSLLQLQYYSASNAQAYSGFDASFSWSSPSYSVKFFSKTPAGSSTPVLTTGLGASSSVKDRWFAIFASVDLASGYAGWGFSSQAARSESTGSASFPSDAIFDSHTLLTLCPDVKCRIRNVQIFYNYYNPFPMDLALGTFATKIGRYPLTELNGNLITSDLNTMGQGHLGSDPANPDPTTTPTWSTSGLPGLTFTSKTQYVTLPYFSIAESTDTLHPILTSSMTISLWIKINTFPTSGYDYIFRYSDSSLATDRMNMKVSQSGVVVCDYRGASSSASVALKISEWTQVTITYGYYKSQTNNFIFSIMYWAIGKAWNYGGISTNNVNYQFGSQPTDKIMIGGFIGEMGEFSLFSPGSLIRDPPCNPTTCNLDLGFSSPGTCIWGVCPTGSYTFMSGCLTCPEGCATCTSAQTCQSCSLGYQLSSSKCNKCPAQTFATASGCVACSVSNCDICSNPTTCFKCLPGFDKYNNQCLTSCGDGNYRDPSDGTCKPCDSKCSQCTSPTACQACNSPAVLNSGTSQCECGAGTYLDAGTCKPCDSKCSQCTSPTVCQACNSPFDLNSVLSQCECSKGSYLDAGTCKPCDSKCSACTDLTTCTECKPGYDLNNFSCIEPVTTIVAKNEDSTLSPGLVAVISVASVGVASGGIYLGFLFRRRLRNKVKKVRPEPGSNSPQKALQNTEEVPVETPAVDQVQSIA